MGLEKLIDGPFNEPLKCNLEEAEVQRQLCKGKKTKIAVCLMGNSNLVSWRGLWDSKIYYTEFKESQMEASRWTGKEQAWRKKG